MYTHSTFVYKTKKISRQIVPICKVLSQRLPSAVITDGEGKNQETDTEL